MYMGIKELEDISVMDIRFDPTGVKPLSFMPRDESGDVPVEFVIRTFVKAIQEMVGKVKEVEMAYEQQLVVNQNLFRRINLLEEIQGGEGIIDAIQTDAKDMYLRINKLEETVYQSCAAIGNPHRISDSGFCTMT